MGVFGTPQRVLVRGAGCPGVGRRRQGIPGPPGRHRCQRLGPRPPVRHLGDLQPARHAGPRLQFLHQPHADRARRETAGHQPTLRPAPRCSSPTPAPKPTRPRSSWPAATRDNAPPAPTRQKRTKIIALEGAFHGRTMGALALTAKEAYRDRSSHCPAASSTSRSVTSRPSCRRRRNHRRRVPRAHPGRSRRPAAQRRILAGGPRSHQQGRARC